MSCVENLSGAMTQTKIVSNALRIRTDCVFLFGHPYGRICHIGYGIAITGTKLTMLLS